MDINPTLQGDLLLITQLELIGSTSVAGTLYGIAFALYLLYVYSSLPQLRSHDRKTQTIVMISATTGGMLLGLATLAINVWIIQDAFIKHYNFPGGPVAYESTILKVPTMICHVCNWLIVLIFDAIQVCFFIKWYCHPCISPAVPRYGVCGQFGVSQDMENWSSYYPCCAFWDPCVGFHLSLMYLGHLS
jgi:hypothetical protein